jgi:hypothetical protein
MLSEPGERPRGFINSLLTRSCGFVPIRGLRPLDVVWRLGVVFAILAVTAQGLAGY